MASLDEIAVLVSLVYLWEVNLVGLLEVVSVGDDEVVSWNVLDSD